MRPGLHRVLERRAVHPADRRRDDVVEVLLAAAVPLHRVEAQLRGGDVVLAVRPADDLVDRALHGDRARLDELRPVEQLKVAVEALRPPRVDGDQVPELPVVAGRELDPLGMGDGPHDRRGHRRAEVAVELGEGNLAAEGGGHRPKDIRDQASAGTTRPSASSGGAPAERLLARVARDLVPGVVAGADERARLHVPEAHRHGLVPHRPRTRRGGSSARAEGGPRSAAGTGRW